IQTSIRYFSSENFVGSSIDGYKTSRIIMTKPTAEALSKVQKELLSEGYSLVVYDAYRPQKAVNHFVRWGNNEADIKMKAQYYPNVDKKAVFDLGYVATKSGHSRGSTVDLTIIRVGEKLKIPTFQLRSFETAQAIPFLDDGTVDMGSSFDLFDEASHHESTKIPEKYHTWRRYLRKKMEKYGFKIYQDEWWHYTLINEPFPATYFDFDIE
ncbi:M15 family metallopeptidase, partial [Candidatus Dependentiae bacterium]|nr:M15 family metallopeptidase [Candidatus Dependentiae bacterium]